MANDNVTVKPIIFKNVYYITVDKNKTKQNQTNTKKKTTENVAEQFAWENTYM